MSGKTIGLAMVAMLAAVTTSPAASVPQWESIDQRTAAVAYNIHPRSQGLRDRERKRARQHAAAYARLSAGQGLRGQQQREAQAAGRAWVATVQPHFATTHPWVQRPVAQAGWYLPPLAYPGRVLLRRRPILLRQRIIVRSPIIVRPPIILPRRGWRSPRLPGPRRYW